MPLKIVRIAAPIVAAILVSGCAAHLGGRHRATNAEVVLISFGATNGELKDCGCHSNPKGGLAHRGGYIDSLRAGGKEFALLDLGDFMNNEVVVGDLKSRFIWKLMEEMGYWGSTPGPRELSNWDLYAELLVKSSIRSVATNLAVARGGTESRAGAEFLVREFNGVRVGIFSLIGASDAASATPPEGTEFRVRDPLATARTLVPKLKAKADLVVLMSQMSVQETETLVRQVPGIDVALCGRQPAWVDQPKLLGQTVLQQTGTRGQYLGELKIIVDPAGQIVEWGAGNTPLGHGFREKPEVLAKVHEIEDRAKEMRATAMQSESERVGARGGAGGPESPGEGR